MHDPIVLHRAPLDPAQVPMPIATRRPVPVAFRLAVVAALVAVAPASQAAQNNAPPDSLTALLIEHGLVPSKSMARAVRDRAAEIALAAMNFLDVPYVWGGNSADEGFDCSGFTRHIYQRIAGIVLPRHAQAQAVAAGFKAIERHELAPGDLVFFNTLRQTFSHVGIYIGDGKFVHAPKAGALVRVENLDQSSYWRGRFTGARRAEHLDAQTARVATPE